MEGVKNRSLPPAVKNRSLPESRDPERSSALRSLLEKAAITAEKEGAINQESPSVRVCNTSHTRSLYGQKGLQSLSFIVMQADTRKRYEKLLPMNPRRYQESWRIRPIFPSPPFTVTDAHCIIDCLRETPRINTFMIANNFHVPNDGMLNVF
jgi:hypothetical protein